MPKEIFSVNINANKKKVWEILWNDQTYRKWTSVFSEESYIESDWKVGGKTLFLDGKGSGMVSTIDRLQEYEIMSFKHLGMLKDGKEDLESEEVQMWAGSLETYTLETIGEETRLSVALDLDESYKDFFMDAFPKALNVVKELSEK